MTNLVYKSWEWRSIDDMKKLWANLLSKRKDSTNRNSSPTHLGQRAEPLFDIPVSNIIPCNLHTTMSQMKSLRNGLYLYVENSDTALAHLEVTYKELGIKVPTVGETTLDRLKKTRFSRPNAVKLLVHQDSILKCLEFTNLNQEIKDLIKLVWKQALVLLTIASSAHPNSLITEEAWMVCAKEYATNFMKCFAVQVSSYMHCFVYHYGYFLVKHCGMEYLSGYSIETNIAWIKKNTFTSTNHFGGKELNACWGQLIEKHLRCQDRFKALLLQKREKPNWADNLFQQDTTVQDLSIFTLGRLMEESVEELGSLMDVAQVETTPSSRHTSSG